MFSLTCWLSSNDFYITYAEAFTEQMDLQWESKLRTRGLYLLFPFTNYMTEGIWFCLTLFESIRTEAAEIIILLAEIY